MNNIGILKKVAEELAKDSPKLDYVRGMVETLIDIQGNEIVVMTHTGETTIIPKENLYKEEKPQDEASILDAQAKAQLARTMELASKSIEK